MIVPLEDALVVPNKKIYSKYFAVKKRIFVNFYVRELWDAFFIGRVGGKFLDFRNFGRGVSLFLFHGASV